MENATKALLIAAAILIAILIISMGIVVYRNSAEQVNNADLSDVQKTSFNSKFEQYAGTQSKENVKALAKLVLNNNFNKDNPDVTFTYGSGTTGITINSSTPGWSGEWDNRLGKATYKVEIGFDSATGLVSTITVK